MSLVDTITNGMNNPDCAFYVGAYIGQVTLGLIVAKVMITYFVLRALEKIVYFAIPKIYRRLKRGMKK